MTYVPSSSALSRFLSRGSLIALSLLIATTSALFSCSGWQTYKAARALIPPNLHPSFFYHGSLRSPQGVAIFSIEPDAALQEVNRPSSTHLPFQAWSRTPVNLGMILPGECFSFGCGADPDVGREVDQWLARPGSYYQVADSGSDMQIFVIGPDRRSIAVSYFWS